MAGFGTGERFKTNKTKTPGPGSYDPNSDIGYKVDPTSGFLGNDRFIEDNKSGGGTNRSSEPSPRELKQGKDGRSYAWTAQRLLELEKEVDTLKGRIKEKDKLLHEQDAELREKRAAEEALRQTRRQLENGAGQWTAEVEQLKSQLLIAKEKRGKLEKELMDVEGRFQEKDQEVQVLGTEMVKFQEEMANQTSRMRSVNSEIDSLQEQLKSTQEQTSKQNNEITRLTDENQALSSELANKSSELETSLTDAEKNLEMQKASHTEDINSLKMQVDAARQEVSLRAGMIEELEKKVDKFKGRLDTSREQESKLQEANTKLEEHSKGQQTELASVQSKLAQVEAELNTKSKDLEGKEKEVDKLQKLVETAEEASLAATGKAMDMEMELTSKFNEVVALREECTGLKGSVRDKDGIIAELDTQYKAAAAKAKETTAILEELESRVMKTEKDLAEKTHYCGEMQATLAARESEVSELRDTQTNTDERVKTVSEECETQRAHISQLQEHLKCAKDELDNKVSGFEHTTVTLNLKVSEAESKITELQKDLQLKVAALTTAESKLSEAHGELADKAAVLSKMEICHNELNAASQKTEKDLSDQLSSIEKKHELQIATLTAEAGAVTALRKEVASMEAEVRDARSREESLQTDLASALGQLEDVTSLKNQVKELQPALDEAQKRATKAETAAHRFKSELRRGEAVKAEMSRLMEENDVLVKRTQELDADVKGLLTSNTSALGHHNPKQKIQYHLKLKQDFEELKKECTTLLREKFHLEQCIRYLSSVGALEVIPNAYADSARSSQIVVPKSLAGNVNTLTPSSRNQLKWAGRGKAAKMADLSPYHAREDMEQAIEQVKKETTEEVEGFIQSGKECATDFTDGAPASNEEDAEALSSPESQDSPRASPLLDGIDSKIQARILTKIGSIISRRPKRKADTQQENNADRDVF